MIYTYYTKDIWLKDQLAYGLSMMSRPHHPTLGIQLVDIPSPVFPAFFYIFLMKGAAFFRAVGCFSSRPLQLPGLLQSNPGGRENPRGSQGGVESSCRLILLHIEWILVESRGSIVKYPLITWSHGYNSQKTQFFRIENECNKKHQRLVSIRAFFTCHIPKINKKSSGLGRTGS